MERLNSVSDGGSGRNVIYSSLLSAWTNSSNVFNLIFGYGHTMILELSVTGLLAHNDWLELLINYGLIGVILYLVLFVLVLIFY